ncbi:MAG TPA: hypothetical protein VFM04_00685 [Candidatus Methylomirabilis sp.]|nr:hypothetical protein [Candidatus Methylomirabilis sp.]
MSTVFRQRGMPPILDEIAEAIEVKSRFGTFRQLLPAEVRTKRGTGHLSGG